MEKYLYLFIALGIELIVLLIIIILIFKNKKVQDTLSKFSVFIGNSLKDNDNSVSSFRVNAGYVNLIMNPVLAFGFIWVFTHESLSGYIVPFGAAIISYLLTLAGFKNWGKSLELDSAVKTAQINKGQEVT